MTLFEKLVGHIDGRRLFLALVSRGLSTVFSFTLIISLARILPAEQYGLYALLFSLASALGLILTAGQTTLILKHFHREDLHGDKTNRDLITHSIQWQLSAVCLAWTGGLLVWISGVGALPFSAVAATLIFAPIFMFSEYFQSYFRSRNQLKIALVPRENVWRPLATGMIWASVLLGITLDGVGALALVATCLLAVVCFQAVVFLRHMNLRRKTPGDTGSDEVPKEAWRRESTYFSLNGLMTAVALHIEVIMVGFVLGLEEVALFFVLFRLAMLLNLPQISMETLAMPMVAERLREGDRRGAQQLLSAFALVTFLLALAGFAILVPLSPFVVKIFNLEFETSRLLAAAIASQTVVMAFFGLGTSTLMIGGGERFFLVYRLFLYAAYAAALVACGWLAGLMGIALTMTAFVLIEHLFAAYWCRRKVKVDITAFGALKTFGLRNGRSLQRSR